jgi:hypothetical protein
MLPLDDAKHLIASPSSKYTETSFDTTIRDASAGTVIVEASG